MCFFLIVENCNLLFLNNIFFFFLGFKGILVIIFKIGKNVILDESSKYIDWKLVKCLMKKDFL